MRYIIYITDECRSAAGHHGYEETVTNLADKIEREQEFSWHYYKAPFFIRKKIGRDYRLIAKQIPFKEHDVTVICFASFFSKGDFELDNFDVETVVIPDTEELEGFINDKLAGGELPAEPETPDEYESAYLNPIHGKDDPLDLMVYESQEWVDAMKEKDGWPRESFDSIHKLVERACWDDDVDLELDNSRIHIFFKRFDAPRSVFLLGLSQDQPTNSEIADKYSLLTSETILTEDLLRQFSKKAYPRIITADLEIWKLIQKDETANLALSSEETHILESVSKGGEEKIYPLFINGRPGSGKSTILHYLFANYLAFYLSQSDRQVNPPLYLTYSQKLLDVSKTNIKSILRLNSSRLQRLSWNDHAEKGFDEIRDICFGEFHVFLRKLISEEQASNFVPDNRMDFPRFRREYLEIRWRKRELTRLDPETAWHVIRGYIKGMSDSGGGYFDPVDYKQFDSKRKTVTQETFDLVFEHVWEGWYKEFCREGRYWDNQDLTRAILDSGQEISKYPVVFCDEAQDFTPNELELILRLSLFSNRKLQPFQLKQVPFAFAGDPFQTLNPTGFDWEKMKSTFHEKIVQELDRTDKSGLEFNYQELRFNYRSSKDIAGVCNLIQLVRGLIFNTPRIEPQQSWQRDVSDTKVPTYFSTSNQMAVGKLSEQKDLVIILPCQDGEEETYIADDPILKNLKVQGKNINMLSAMGAKGLEFARVVIYKFGDTCLQEFPDLGRKLSLESHEDEINSERKLSWEYFFNRLYVAVSRPKRELYILDSDEGIESFWKSNVFTRTDTVIEQRNRRSPTIRWTSDDVTLPVPGNEQSISEGLTDDLRSLAEQFRNNGLSTKNSYLLQLASYNYRNVGDNREATLCDAERFKIDEQFENAAQAYLAIDMIQEALECSWNGGCYRQIAREERFTRFSEYRVAKFLSLESNDETLVSILRFVGDELRSANKARIVNSQGWSDCMRRLIERAVTDNGRREDPKAVYWSLKNIYDNWPNLPKTRELADVAFRAEEYADVFTLYKDRGEEDQNSPQYIISKYETSQADLDPDAVRRLHNAYLTVGLYQRAYEIANKYNFEDLWTELLKRVPFSDEHSIILSGTISELVKLYASSNRFEKINELLERKDLALREVKPLISNILDVIEPDGLSGAQAKDIESLFKILSRIEHVSSPNDYDIRKIGDVLKGTNQFVKSLGLIEKLLNVRELSAETLELLRSEWFDTKSRQIAYARSRNQDAKRYEREISVKRSEWGVKDVSIKPEAEDAEEIKPRSRSLTGEQKQMAHLAKNAGKTPKEIADFLGVSVDSVISLFIKSERKRHKRK
ncbi:MAG: hypothetical protein HS105_02675 [Chloracidobacterium sp.]|nr:hypothetical protein [Chloracidobacterium sp.]